MAVFNMSYASEVLYNVTDVLYNIKERGGMAPSSFLQAEYNRLQGQYAAIVINVALVAMGKKPAIDDGKFSISDAQMNSLVERAKQQNGMTLHQIAELRAAKSK